MSKTILLELTEKEADLVGLGIIKEKYSWEEKDPKETSRTLIENNLSSCNSIWAKLDEARQPKRDALLTYKDLFSIIDFAKGDYRNLPSDLHISNKKVELSDYKHISLANAVIVWLNSNNLLKRLARFDFTDKSCQYEEME